MERVAELTVQTDCTPVLKILLKLSLDLTWSVALAQHFHRQVGSQVGNRLVRYLIFTQSRPRNKSHIGKSNESRTKTKGAIGTSQVAEIVDVEKIPQQAAD